MTDEDTPLDRLFVEDATERPDEIVVDEMTTLDASEFVARLEMLSNAAQVVSTMANDVARLRSTGLSDEDARDLIYGRNSGLTKTEIKAMFDAVDDLAHGDADRPVERLLSENLERSGSERGPPPSGGHDREYGPVCRYCGMPIHHEGQRCAALDNGVCRP